MNKRKNTLLPFDGRLKGLFVAFATGAVLAACSSSDSAKTPGADKPYPNLATVPGQRPNTPTVQERIQVQEGLMSDRENARHIDGPKAGQSTQTGIPADPGNVRSAIVTPPSQAQIAARAAAARRAAQNPPPPRPELRIRQNGYVTTIPFPNGATSLPPGSGALIVKIVELHRWSGGTIILAAHSMTQNGDAATKRARSIARANSVAAGLLNLGVPRNQVRILPLADSRPRFRDAARDGQNSRVDIVIQGAKRR